MEIEETYVGTRPYVQRTMTQSWDMGEKVQLDVSVERVLESKTYYSHQTLLKTTKTLATFFFFFFLTFSDCSI